MLVVAWSWSLIHNQRVPQIFADYTSDVRVNLLLGLIGAWAWNAAISIDH
jgi:hypothetical protein